MDFTHVCMGEGGAEERAIKREIFFHYFFSIDE